MFLVRLYKIIVTFFCLIIFYGCNSEDTLEKTSKVSYIYVNVASSKSENDSLNTKLTRSIAQGTSSVVPYMTYKDSLGIFAEGGTQIPFEVPAAKGEYLTSYKINAQGWSTKEGTLYTVYHPYNFYNRDGGHLYWDLRKVQVQSANNTPTDLGKYWILVSDTCTNRNNIFHTTLSLANAVIRLYCSVPNANNYVKMVIAFEKKRIPIYGYFDLFDISGSKAILPSTYQPFHSIEYTDHITLKFDSCNPIVSGAKNWIVGYYCLPDIDMKGQNLTCYLWDEKGNCYSSSMTLATTSNGNGVWKRNSTVTIVMSNVATLTTTPYTNLNPWEEDKDTCSTCYPVAF